MLIRSMTPSSSSSYASDASIYSQASSNMHQQQSTANNQNHQNNQQQQHPSSTDTTSSSSSSPAIKIFTDFSIKTLIGEHTTTSAEPNTRPHHRLRPKNFQCPACKLAFSNNGQLKSHVRIHTGERPFRCECNKTFTRNEELTRHKLIHTGIRPHECSTCGKRFGRKDHLKKHVRTHERNKIIIKDEPEQVGVESIPENFNIRPQNFVDHPKLDQNPVQQFVNDYWNQWYNIIGYCQQQQHHQQPNLS